MIYGVGIDMELISRIEKSIEQFDHAFLKKIYTPVEIAYCSSKGKPSQHFAARFAAKEAFAKAIGTGWQAQFRWLDVEVVNDQLGKPSIRLYNELANYFSSYILHLSLSHTADSVAAVVVVEQSNIQT